MGYYKARISFQTFSYRFGMYKNGQELGYKNRLLNEIILVGILVNSDVLYLIKIKHLHFI